MQQNKKSGIVHGAVQNRILRKNKYCRGGEMVDALVLGTSPVRGGGSSPLLGTIDLRAFLLLNVARMSF
jgi:hypothetical protein